jgi:hypothetical protein
MAGSQRRLFAGLCLLLLWQSGCAAFRPMHGVPARYLPTDMKIGDRSHRRTIDLSLLRQTPPQAHLIDSGDVLGIYVEGFVGKSTDPAPVFFPQNNDSPPSFGHPYPVREDGTISLPVVGSLSVRGLTLTQAEDRVKQAYLAPRQLIRPDYHRVQVNLQRPRQYRVLVIRQDSRNEPQSNAFFGQLNIGMVKRGTGKVVNLPVYSNDVLNALTATDGLPGLDAENAVYVIRRRGPSLGGALDPRWPTDLLPSLMSPGASTETPIIRGQSPDESAYLHSSNIRQARYLGPPQAPVQQVMAAQPGYSNGMDPRMGASGLPANASLEPPRIWPDRAVSVAYDPSYPPGYDNFGPGAPGGAIPYPQGNSFAPTGPTPIAPNGPTWNGNPAETPNQDVRPYQQPNQQPYPQTYPGPAPAGPPMGYPTGQPPLDNRPAGPAEAPMGMPHQGTPQGAQPGGLPAGSVLSAPMGNHSFTPVPDRGLGMDPGLPLESGHGVLGGDGLEGRHVIKIPIRLGPGETADIRPEDVVLYDGDIVFIESRDTEVFYTGGLLGGGQYTLPRDYDLDILQALSLAQSRGVMGSTRSVGGISALNNDVSISPSTAIVLRKLPDGGEIPVKIDLYRARTDLSERIVIQPGDYILLQYTPLEAIAAFFERHLLETALFSVASQNLNRTSN